MRLPRLARRRHRRLGRRVEQRCARVGVAPLSDDLGARLVVHLGVARVFEEAAVEDDPRVVGFDADGGRRRQRRERADEDLGRRRAVGRASVRGVGGGEREDVVVLAPRRALVSSKRAAPSPSWGSRATAAMSGERSSVGLAPSGSPVAHTCTEVVVRRSASSVVSSPASHRSLASAAASASSEPPSAAAGRKTCCTERQPCCRKSSGRTPNADGAGSAAAAAASSPDTPWQTAIEWR